MNETRLMAVDNTSHRWWVEYRIRAEQARRQITIEQSSAFGEQVIVACDNEAHAVWLAEHLQHIGAPRSAVKVVSPRPRWRKGTLQDSIDHEKRMDRGGA